MKESLQTLFAIFLMLLISGSAAHGQITITDSDILGLIGQTQLVEIDTTGEVTVTVGSAGANQSWDLSGPTITGITLEVLFEDPAGTPFFSTFPTANLARSTTDSSGQEGFSIINIFEYISISPTQFETLGSGIEVPDLDTSFVEVNSNDVAPLPLTFNTSWTTMSADTAGDLSTFGSVGFDTTDNVVDGWGTITLPIGTFDCLRVRADSRYHDETYIGGQVVSSFSGSSISYSWVSKDNFILAEAESDENDTNPNFTTAAEFFRLSAIPTSLADQPAHTAPAEFQLWQNYPNPFNPSTTIRYALPIAADVQLTIYDVSGKSIRTAVSRQQSAGSHQHVWDGKNDQGQPVASGVYFYQLQADGISAVRKMLLTR